MTEGTSHPDSGQTPEGVEPKPELTPLEKYEQFGPGSWDKPEPVASDAGEAPAVGSQDDPPAAPEPPQPEQTPEAPRKLKYKAHGQEHEATEDEAAQALSAHADYMRNIQRVRDMEASLMAKRDVLDIIENNPHARAALLQALQPAPVVPGPNADPLEQFEAGLLAKAEQRIMEKFAPQLAPVQQMQRERVGQAIVQQVAGQYGEDAPILEQAAAMFLEQLPPLARQAYQQAITASPEAMLAGTRELFEMVRPHVEALKKQHQQTPNTQPAATAREVVKQESARRSAPALEGAGAVAPDNSGQRNSLSRERSQILARIRGGSAKSTDSLRLMTIDAELRG
jgi:hypothetical protein